MSSGFLKFMKTFKTIGAALFIMIIIGFTSLSNYVLPSAADYNFDIVANNIKMEMVKVVEHDIKNSESNLRDFVNKTGVHLRNTYPDASFLFIFGNTTEATMINYAIADDKLLEVVGQSFNLSDGMAETFNSPGHASYTIKLNGVDYIAKFYSHTQVYFAIEKQEKDEIFVGFA